SRPACAALPEELATPRRGCGRCGRSSRFRAGARSAADRRPLPGSRRRSWWRRVVAPHPFRPFLRTPRFYRRAIHRNASARPKRAHDSMERWPITSRPAATAVDDQLIGVLRDFRIEIVVKHAQGGFLMPTLAAQLASARGAQGGRDAHAWDSVAIITQ